MTKTRTTTWLAQIAVVLLLLASGMASGASGFLAANSPLGENAAEAGSWRASAALSGEPHQGCGDLKPQDAAELFVAPAARPVPQGHTRVYRAVSEAEYQQILRTGRFEQGPNSLEGKWFADTLEGAQAHGRALHPQGGFRIIEADVPNNAPSLFQQPNLDGRGPARFLHMDDLGNVRPRPVE
jgi:hypothetical protein